MTRNNELLKQWVIALRSDEFKQGRGRLQVDDTYCCLGVCAVKVFNRPDIAETQSLLPDEMGDELGLTDEDLEKLVTMNDILGKSFNYIADWIEKNLIQE